MESRVSKEVNTKLPLKISQVRWDFNCLTVNGVKNGIEWHVSTGSSWRLTKQGQYICGPDDRPYPEILKRLKKAQIISVCAQSNEFPIDPVFYLSNGYCLEIFTETYLEPWCIGMSPEYLYIQDPFDPDYFLDKSNDN